MHCSCEHLPHGLRRPAHITHETIAHGVQRVAALAPRYLPFLRHRQPDAEILRMVREDEEELRHIRSKSMQALLEAEYNRILRIDPTRAPEYVRQRREHHGDATD